MRSNVAGRIRESGVSGSKPKVRVIVMVAMVDAPLWGKDRGALVPVHEPACLA
jgi:hypothetical protein